MLACSPRPVRDRADLVVAALGLRLGRMTRSLLVVAMLGVGAFTFGLIHAVGQLEHGVVEILDHWWSTFILAGFGTMFMAATILAFAHRRATAWRRPS